MSTAQQDTADHYGARPDVECPQSTSGTHEPLAAGDARDGGPVHCRHCQWPIQGGNRA